MIIMATATPDSLLHRVSLLLQLARNKCFAYDLQAACSSFCNGMSPQLPTFNQEGIKKVLINRADKMSLLLIIQIVLLVLFFVTVQVLFYLSLIRGLGFTR
jgi:3-oxoacyl-[acyl-carrier-protein] synthase-3